MCDLDYESVLNTQQTTNNQKSHPSIASPLIEGTHFPIDLHLEDSKFVDLVALESFASKTLPSEVVIDITRDAAKEADPDKRLILQLQAVTHHLKIFSQVQFRLFRHSQTLHYYTI